MSTRDRSRALRSAPPPPASLATRSARNAAARADCDRSGDDRTCDSGSDSSSNSDSDGAPASDSDDSDDDNNGYDDENDGEDDGEDDSGNRQRRYRPRPGHLYGTVSRRGQAALTPSAALEGFAYLAAYQVLACVACAHGVGPGSNEIMLHLRRYHRDWPLARRRSVCALASQLPLRLPEDVLLPTGASRLGPVSGIRIYGGWKCRHCGYLGVSEATMREHCRQVHRWTKAQGSQWTATELQTFFDRPRRRLFEITREAHADPGGDLRNPGDALSLAAERLLQTDERREEKAAQEAARMPDGISAAESSPWLRKTRWARRFAGRDLRAIAATAARPDKEEGSLRLVWESVERVLERCRASVAQWHEEEEDGDVVLSWLASPQTERCSPRPFSVYYEAATHRRYASDWARLLCYLLRLVCADDQHGYMFAAGEEHALRQVWELVELEQADDAALDRRIFDLSVALWTHEARAQSRSAIVLFTAVLGIDSHRGCFYLPSAYAPKLPGLLYCARLLLFERALPAAHRRGIGDPLGHFLTLHRRWLVDGRATPFNYVDNLLAYALGAARDVGGKASVLWSADRRTLIYRGEQIPLADLRRLAGDLLQAAEETLVEDLLFLTHRRSTWGVDLTRVVDDMTEITAGYWFGSSPRNGLSGCAAQALRTLVKREQQAPATLLRIGAGGELEVRPAAWRRLLARLQRFQMLLFLLVHLCSGPPARGTEILPVRYVNAPHAPRNVFIYDGQVVMVTAYHKSQSITGQHKVIARFLPNRVGQLLVAYTTAVLPLCALLDRTGATAAARGFLWADASGPWHTRRASEALARETSTRLGVRVKLQDYRHIAKAIDREHVRSAPATAGLEEGEEQEGEEGSDALHDLAAGHLSHTADYVYAVDASMLRSLSARTLSSFRVVSSRWHRFWQLDYGEAHAALKRPASEAPLVKRRRTDDNPDGEQRANRLQGTLQRLLGAGASFRSALQQEAVEEVDRGTSPLVVVLPTGSGKSLIFQLPAALPGAGTTIVVLPFRALAADLVRRCRELGLSSSVWTSNAGAAQGTRMLFVSAEAAACNDAFLTFAAALQAQGRLDRIVVDECHVPLTAASYRHALVHLDRLRAVPCQLVLLTGTLPPAMQPELEDAFLLGSAAQGLCYLRASTDRPQFEYRVETRTDAAAVEDHVADLVQSALQAPAGRQRAILFCRSQADTERMAARLGCRPYHRAFEDKEESFAAWAGGEAGLIVATSALGTGVDVAGVELAVHLGRPHGIIDFVQEAGRAGREGVAHARSVVVLTAGELRWLESEAAREREWNREALRQYLVEDRCRRRRLTAIMDGREQGCDATAGRLRCDLCQTQALAADSEQEGVAVADVNALEAAAEQARRYAVGPQLVRERVQKQSAERQQIEEAVAAVGRSCAACWVRGATGEQAEHTTDGCVELERAIGQQYRIVRRQIRLEKGCYSCFRCGLPGDWCIDYSLGRRCTQPDVVFGLAIAAWATYTARIQVVPLSQVHSLSDLITRLGQATRVGGSKASRVIEIVQKVVEFRSRGRGSIQ